MDEFYYELKYINGQHEVIHKFPADIDITQLADYLKDFLKGCSWYESQVDKLIQGGE